MFLMLCYVFLCFNATFYCKLYTKITINKHREVKTTSRLNYKHESNKKKKHISVFKIFLKLKKSLLTTEFQTKINVGLFTLLGSERHGFIIPASSCQRCILSERDKYLTLSKNKRAANHNKVKISSKSLLSEFSEHFCVLQVATLLW